MKTTVYVPVELEGDMVLVRGRLAGEEAAVPVAPALLEAIPGFGLCVAVAAELKGGVARVRTRDGRVLEIDRRRLARLPEPPAKAG
ncbi:MAG TPA: hypothetical protein VIL46_03720 [Gemmataceae bacterium]